MATDVDICNLALTHIGSFPVNTLAEATKEASVCNRLYPVARDTVLREHPWNFATKSVTLALTSETHPKFTFVYGLPADCLLARKLVNTTSDKTLPYEITLNAAETGHVVVTDQEDAVLTYTATITNPVLYDTEFVDALSWRLAADLAMPLRGDQNMQTAAMNMYFSLMQKAKAVDANEGRRNPSDSCSFLDARV